MRDRAAPSRPPLKPYQMQEARELYSIALHAGLRPERAQEFVLVALHESGLNQNAKGVPVQQYGGRRAAGDFQLLSDGYVQRAEKLGGVYDTRANALAILPDYIKFWRQNPNAPIGLAGAKVEASGKGAEWYGQGSDALNFLRGGGPQVAPQVGGAGFTLGATPESAFPAGYDPRKAFTDQLLSAFTDVHTSKERTDKMVGAISSLQARGAPEVRVDQDVPQLSPNASDVVRLAGRFLGTPYKWGGADPRSGFDCSGFVQYVLGKQGVSVPRTTYEQIKHGAPVTLAQLQPGDVLFFGTKDDPHHEGMYIGHGQFIHAPHTGDVVKISSLSGYYMKHFVAARRMG